MHSRQNDIMTTLQVKSSIDPAAEMRERINFLKAYLKKSGMTGYVLGISGGQDSTLAGKLIQMAVSELNEEERGAAFVFYGLRLPYGEQADEDDAAKAIDYIKPDRTFTVNVKPAVDASAEQFKQASGESLSDFVKGNTKARERMKVQYDFAGEHKLLVAGTDHAAEAVTGFYTKFGDGACDVAPLFGLTKTQGKQLLDELGAPSLFSEKAPTADLESDRPQLTDEEALGVSYDDIDAYLQGEAVSDKAAETIESWYGKTEHKRQMPVTPFEHWWQH
ncbi:ammonia-dependent NAD(+) synthetase [Alkalicoccus chagannorensis]|uniref:ammonia-dependent NAD(+) synthetase n=1 Tax=Alkalicoccus chagannorensis TaxID=427072 RepID=UPI00047A6503|nr:ammonia-dependent NAD(+) synthetase [Alkalicoccus chagannorensis]